MKRARASRWELVLAVCLAAPATLAADGQDHELTVVPVAGGSSDIGLGAGYVASYARLAPGVRPYLWRLESAGAVSGRFGPSPRLGYLDDYLLFVIPHVSGERLRFEAELGYTDEPGLTYYGLGNASAPAAAYSGSERYYTFERAYAHARTTASYGFASHLVLVWGVSATSNEIAYPGDGRLAGELVSGDRVTKRLLNVRRRLEVVEFSYGLGWDSRDNDVSTHRGQYHTLRIDLAPGGAGVFPFGWGRSDLALRAYLPLVPRRLTFAARGVLDVLFGNPPFYELSRFDETQALGGGRGVRGVPAGRYYGSCKVFVNLELRSELFAFRAFKKRNVFGLTGFFDAGRLWSALPATPALDGEGLGLKFGTGLGARLAGGDSFVLRGDVAWSPDARPVGVYLLAGELF